MANTVIPVEIIRNRKERKWMLEMLKYTEKAVYKQNISRVLNEIALSRYTKFLEEKKFKYKIIDRDDYTIVDSFNVNSFYLYRNKANINYTVIFSRTDSINLIFFMYYGNNNMKGTIPINIARNTAVFRVIIEETQ